MKFTAAIALFFAASASAYNTQPPADRRAFLAKAGAVSAAFVAATPAANAIFGMDAIGADKNPKSANSDNMDPTKNYDKSNSIAIPNIGGNNDPTSANNNPGSPGIDANYDPSSNRAATSPKASNPAK